MLFVTANPKNTRRGARIVTIRYRKPQKYEERGTNSIQANLFCKIKMDYMAVLDHHRCFLSRRQGQVVLAVPFPDIFPIARLPGRNEQFPLQPSLLRILL
jgi:hypothetical protein